jgi:hypothetical protein
MLARLGSTAALALLLAAPAPAATVSIPFDADNFSDPLTIDNQYWPLVPGTTFIYKAEGPDGCEEDHFTVTSDTKLITVNGESVTTRVIEDLAYEDTACDGPDPEDLHEKTFDWHAQDDDGNIWYFGEETYNCDGADDCTLGDGSWESGLDVQGIGSIAMPGLFILANPTTGDAYRQELYEGFAEDWAKIMGKNAEIVLKREDAYPPGEFDDCLVTKEWNDLEGGSIEQKYYCADVGLVLVVEHSGKSLRFELTDPDFVEETNDAFRFRKPR